MHSIRRALLVAPLVLMSLIIPVAPASAAPEASPVGSLDQVFLTPGESVEVYGWAADPDSVDEILEVHVYVDGARGYVLQTGTNDRPDVLAATGASNAGFMGTLPPQGPGTHTACAYAINIGSTGSNTQLGCKQFGIVIESFAPIGSLDQLNFFADGSPVLYGWAADGNDLAQSLEVHLYVDGARGYIARTGTNPRPDVAGAVGAPDAGFVAVLPPQGPGQHTVCAYAINIGPTGPNTQLGCKTYGFAVQSYAPVGSLDQLNFFADGSPVLYGWAADRNDLAQTLEVHLYVDGRGYITRTGTHPRPDVAAATGAPNAGFVAILPPQGPGRHTVCAYAINIGPAGPNTQLGCRTYGDYANCDAVRAAGAAPIYRGQPGYGPHLDSDGDGIGCER